MKEVYINDGMWLAFIACDKLDISRNVEGFHFLKSLFSFYR